VPEWCAQERNVVWAAILVGLIPITGWAVPVTVFFEPSASVVDPGDIFTVDLKADIPDPVLGWGLDVSFDTAILSLGSITIDPLWFPGTSFDGDGLVGLAFPTAISGTDIRLAQLTFTGLSPGTTSLVASATALDFTEGFALFPTGFADVTFVEGSVSVTPEPGTFLLMSTGLLVMLGYGWRRRRKKAA
jgi:hypothetical protein